MVLVGGRGFLGLVGRTPAVVVLVAVRGSSDDGSQVGALADDALFLCRCVPLSEVKEETLLGEWKKKKKVLFSFSTLVKSIP